MTPLISKSDVVRLFKLLTGLYPMSAKVFEQADELTRDTWHSLLSDLPRDAVFSALKKHAALSRFPPTIAELRREVVAMEHPELTIDSAMAWAMVKEVLRNGSKREDIHALPMIVQDAAKAIGWYDLRNNDNPEAVRAQFARQYEQRVEGAIKERQSQRGAGSASTLLQMPKEGLRLSQ